MTWQRHTWLLSLSLPLSTSLSHTQTHTVDLYCVTWVRLNQLAYSLIYFSFYEKSCHVWGTFPSSNDHISIAPKLQVNWLIIVSYIVEFWMCVCVLSCVCVCVVSCGCVCVLCWLLVEWVMCVLGESSNRRVFRVSWLSNFTCVVLVKTNSFLWNIISRRLPESFSSKWWLYGSEFVWVR